MLQQEMAVLHRTFQAAYPGRKGFAMSGTPRASKMAGGAASALLHLGQTPRTRELFMSGAGTGDGTDRAVHGSALSDVFGVASTGATTQSSQRLRARSLGAGRRPSSSSSRVVKTPARRVCACVA